MLSVQSCCVIYAECHINPFMLSVIMLSVVVLSVVAPSYDLVFERFCRNIYNWACTIKLFTAVIYRFLQ
jgi:hypothetical protein